MSFVIVPDHLREAINAKLDAATVHLPILPDRDHLYRQLLAYYNEHGLLPEFTVEQTTNKPKE